METMRLVWGPENHLFSIGAVNHSLPPAFQATHVFQRPDRMSWGKLLKLPVTCIVIQDMLRSSPLSSPSWFTDLWPSGSLPGSYSIFIDDGDLLPTTTYKLLDYIPFENLLMLHVTCDICDKCNTCDMCDTSNTM